jgi:hypothetical protein
VKETTAVTAAAELELRTYEVVVSGVALTTLRAKDVGGAADACIRRGLARDVEVRRDGRTVARIGVYAGRPRVVLVGCEPG